jgi:hypothetical protein
MLSVTFLKEPTGARWLFGHAILTDYQKFMHTNLMSTWSEFAAITLVIIGGKETVLNPCDEFLIKKSTWRKMHRWDKSNSRFWGKTCTKIGVKQTAYTGRGQNYYPITILS